jgi:hypothetical protein
MAEDGGNAPDHATVSQSEKAFGLAIAVGRVLFWIPIRKIVSAKRGDIVRAITVQALRKGNKTV